MTLLPDDRRAAALRLPARRGFCAYALEDWIELAAKTGVPMVDAERVAIFETADLKHHEQEGPHQGRLDSAFATALAARRASTMMRFDVCASAELKLRMSETGDAATDGARQQLPIDMRLLECLEEWPRLTMPAWQRPWIGEQIRREAGWPVEYRAIVHNGKLEAITSYYIQRPLRENASELTTVATLARELAAATRAPYEWEARTDQRLRVRKHLGPLTGTKPSSDAADPDKLQATMDFVATTHGIVLLEGGPPPWAGGHPCCFAGRKGRARGVLLAPGREPAPMPKLAWGPRTPALTKHSGRRQC